MIYAPERKRTKRREGRSDSELVIKKQKGSCNPQNKVRISCNSPHERQHTVERPLEGESSEEVLGQVR